MIKLNSYLNFNGDCEKAFEFYRSVFGGEFLTMSRFSEMPDDPKFQIGENDKTKIMHVSLPIAEGITLMGCDALQPIKQGDNYAISINLDCQKEAERLFSGLSAQGKITMPLNKTFWNSYFGMFTDQFGVQWMVNCDLNEAQ